MPKRSIRSPSLTSQESYKGVIIADLVAEIQISTESSEDVQKRDSAVKLSKTLTKDDKHGYDGPCDLESNLSPNPLSDSVKTSNELSKIGNGSEKSLNKGVILNASNFESIQSKLQGDHEMQNIFSAKKGTDIPNGTKPIVIPTPEEKTEMSPLRKVAFVFSFLPSILFILCIAIIVPCQIRELRVHEIWSLYWNNSDVTSHFSTPYNYLVGLVDNNTSYVKCFNKTTGEIIWENEIDSPVRYLECIKWKSGTNGTEDCFVMDATGNLYAFDITNGTLFWKENITNADQVPSLPVFLPNCTEGNLLIAAALTHKAIKYGSPEVQFQTLGISGCKSIPSKLTLWGRNYSNDLIFYCETSDETGSFIKIPQNSWCSSSGENTSTTFVTKEISILKDSIIFPITQGLIIWESNQIYLVQPDGNISWNVSTQTHRKEKRFIKFGTFHQNEEEIVLFSSELYDNLTIETLNPRNGNITSTFYCSNIGFSEVLMLSGGLPDGDLILVAINKADFNSNEGLVSRLNGAKITLMNILSTNVYNGTNTKEAPLQVVQELAYLKFDKTIEFHLLHKYNLTEENSEGKLYETSLKGNLPTEGNKNNLTLTIMNFKKYENKKTTTKVINIIIENWDTSIKEQNACKL